MIHFCLLLSAFAEPPKITISKETTYITAPLRADGMVDYLAWANAPLKEIKPEENGAMWLVRALGPEAADKETTDEYFRLMGCDPPPDHGECLFKLEKMPDYPKLKEQNAFHDRVDRYQFTPWKLNEEPLLEDWLQRNEAPLKIVARASQCKQFLEPIVSNAKSPPLIPNTNTYAANRLASDLLTFRAMERLRRGKTDEAVADLETVYRLNSLHVRSRGELVGGLVACAIRIPTFRADAAVAVFGGMTSRQLRERGNRLLKLESADQIIDPVSSFENVATTSILWSTMCDPSGGFDPENFKPHPPAAIDEGLRTHQRWRERMAEAFKHPAAECEKRLQAMEQELKHKQKKAEERDSSGAKADATTLGREAAEDFALLHIGACRVVHSARNRLTVRQRQAYLAYMIRAYKLDHGRYPERLDAKAIGAPPETTIDAFTEKPFDYRIESGKARVLCRGADGRYTQPVEGGYDDIVLELQ